MTLNISMNYGSVGSLFIQVGSLVDVTAGSAIVLQNAADSQASGTVTVPPSSYYNAYVDVGGTPSYWIETY
jgi:formylmethanofuran dehydrogenase subunit D